MTCGRCFGQGRETSGYICPACLGRGELPDLPSYPCTVPGCTRWFMHPRLRAYHIEDEHAHYVGLEN